MKRVFLLYPIHRNSVYLTLFHFCMISIELCENWEEGVKIQCKPYQWKSKEYNDKLNEIK